MIQVQLSEIISEFCQEDGYNFVCNAIREIVTRESGQNIFHWHITEQFRDQWFANVLQYKGFHNESEISGSSFMEGWNLDTKYSKNEYFRETARARRASGVDGINIMIDYRKWALKKAIAEHGDILFDFSE
jgi:hypothetical protein